MDTVHHLPFFWIESEQVFELRNELKLFFEVQRMMLRNRSCSLPIFVVENFNQNL